MLNETSVQNRLDSFVVDCNLNGSVFVLSVRLLFLVSMGLFQVNCLISAVCHMICIRHHDNHLSKLQAFILCVNVLIHMFSFTNVKFIICAEP
jgi:hypothetical protein